MSETPSVDGPLPTNIPLPPSSVDLPTDVAAEHKAAASENDMNAAVLDGGSVDTAPVLSSRSGSENGASGQREMSASLPPSPVSPSTRLPSRVEAPKDLEAPWDSEDDNVSTTNKEPVNTSSFQPPRRRRRKKKVFGLETMGGVSNSEFRPFEVYERA